MHIIQHNLKTRYKVGAIIVVLLSFLTLNRTYLTEEVFIVVDKAMVYDLGFSDPGQLGKSFSEIAEQLIIKSPDIIKGNIFGFPERPQIDRLDIIIKFIDYREIINDQQRAITQTILTDPTEVKGKVVYDNKAYKADIRLKGDLRDHWRSSIRMSFRVSLKTKGTVKDFRSFSIQKPKARQYPSDQVYQSLIIENGGLATTHNFIHLFVNGEDWGIMNIEEHMSKELLEKQRRKESLIFKLGDDQKWAYTDQNGLRDENVRFEDKPYHEGYRLSDPKFYITAYKSNKYLKEEQNRNYYSYVMNQMYDNNDIFDTNAFTKNYLMAKVWGANHTLDLTNSRFYFNPYTLMLEPISMDQGAFVALDSTKITSINDYFKDINTYYSGLSSRKDFKQNFAKNFNSVMSTTNKIDNIYSSYKNYFPINRPIDVSIIHENRKLLDKLYIEEKSLDIPASQSRSLHNTTPTQEQSNMVPSHTFIQHYIDGKIRIHNLLPVPIKLIGIYHNDKRISVDITEIPSYKEKKFIDINSSIIGINDHTFRVTTELMGKQQSSVNNFSLNSNVISPFKENIPIEAEKFIQLKNGKYYFLPGIWEINEAIVLNKPVIIQEGTKLLFSENAFLLIKGALQATGSENNKIIFAPKEVNANWGGIYVRLAEERSLLRYVDIIGTNEFNSEILKLTGGVTFYKSDVSIENTEFSHNNSEDALNIVESDFIISHSRFHHSPSDALDSDFSTGLVFSSEFQDIEGDALDYSGSVVIMKDLYISNIKDKGVSGGEGSELTVKNSFMENVNIGIASKDGSHVIVSDLEIINPIQFALMSYLKKSFWGKASLKATNLTIPENSYLSQAGSQLIIDDVIMKNEELDVKSLYQE